MKFLKNKIEDVDSYIANPNCILYTTKGNLKNKPLFLNDICITEGVSNYIFFKDKVLYNKWKNSDSFIYDTIEKTTIEIKNSRVFSTIGDIVIYKKNDEYFYKNNLLETLFSSKNRLLVISKNIGIITSVESILAKNFNDKIIWELELHKLGKTKYEGPLDEIDKFIGIANENIFVITKGGRFIAINIQTGNVVRKYSTYEEDLSLGYDISLKIGVSTYLQDDEQNIYGMGVEYFQKINTKTCEIEESFEFRNEDPAGIGSYEYIYSPFLQGEYFTFLGEKKHTDGIRFIGLFDYKKRKLVWEYELISKEEFVDGNKLIPPQPAYLSGNKIHVKDFNDTLHILEKN